MESRQPIRPFFAEGSAIAAGQVVTRLLGKVGAHLKARGENQTIQFVFNTINHHAFFSDALNALTLGINQRHVGQVIGSEIFVVKTRALTKLTIVRLQLFSRFGVFNNAIDTRPDLIHFFKVGNFQSGGDF